MKFFVVLEVLSLLVCVADGISMHDPFSCYSTDTIRFVTHLMTDIASYEAIRRFNFTIVNPYTPTGLPSRFWYLGRYAACTATPSYYQRMIDFAESSIQDDIVKNYEEGRTTLCRSDFEAIRNFSMDPDFGTIENANMVVESGVIAMRNIARRFKQTFPKILPETYSPDLFHFRHTIDTRTNVSIRAFASGLFGEPGSQNVIYEEVPDIDWFLRPFDVCPAFTEHIADWRSSRTTFEEEGPEMEELIQQVNRKLGFHASNQLNLLQIFNILTWCKFQTAAKFEISNSEIGGNAPWCSAFSVANFHVLEYLEDLGYFHQSGYGIKNQRLFKNLNCGLVQDLLTHMQSNNMRKARIYVTHAQEVLRMLVLLDAFRDVRSLHIHNFAQQSDRRWRTSMIAAFSSNIAVVRYDSDDGDHDLVFLLNEKPILVPGCDRQTGVCKLSVIRNRFQRFVNANCEVSFCSND